MESLDRSIPFSALFDCEGTGIVLLDRTGNPIRSNRTFRDMLGSGDGYRNGGGLMSNMTEWTSAADWEVERPMWEQLMAGERDHYRITKKCVSGEGRTIWVSATVSLMRHDTQDARLALAIFENVTDRINQEQELRLERERLERLVLLDGLTHIANRRYFDEYLEKQFNSARRDRRPIALVMLDVDYFKEYNNTYGHLHGDECIKRIAEALKKTIKRPKDMAARYGGEEFSVILPDTDANGAKKVAKRLHAAVADLRIPHELSAASAYISVSAGVAAMIPGRETEYKQLIGMADRALYQVKKHGRNHVMLYREPIPHRSLLCP